MLCGFGLHVENSALLIVLFLLLQWKFRYDVKSSARIIELLLLQKFAFGLGFYSNLCGLQMRYSYNSEKRRQGSVLLIYMCVLTNART